MVPNRLYHGTNYAFEQFDSRHLGRSCRNPTVEFGFFFTEDEADALSWALREQERLATAPRAAKIIEVKLMLEKVKELSYSKFLFYLQRSKISTIQRDKAAWIADGYDGLMVVRGGYRWFAPFNTEAIEIVGVRESQPVFVAPRLTNLSSLR